MWRPVPEALVVCPCDMLWNGKVTVQCEKMHCVDIPLLSNQTYDTTWWKVIQQQVSGCLIQEEARRGTCTGFCSHKLCKRGSGWSLPIGKRFLQFGAYS